MRSYSRLAGLQLPLYELLDFIFCQVQIILPLAGSCGNGGVAERVEVVELFWYSCGITGQDIFKHGLCDLLDVMRCHAGSVVMLM